MALTQIQIIQSLGESMNWLEKELSWGVPIQEQRHLVGRIGELYAALISDGQMATMVNQAGYDVVDKNGQRISVKTTTQKGTSGHLAFNPNTLKFVDRIIVFYLNIEEMQIETLLDTTTLEAQKLFSKSNEKLHLSLGKLRNKEKLSLQSTPVEEQKVIAQAEYKSFTIKELESGSILVFNQKTMESKVKPKLREIAHEINLSILNSNGNMLNTRQLGTLVIRKLNSK